MPKWSKNKTGFFLIIILFVLLISLPLLFAQSKPPTPSPSKISKEQQNKTTPQETQGKTKNYDPNDASTPVKKVPTTAPDCEKSDNTNHADNRPPFDGGIKITDIFLTAFTGLLAVFTYLLWDSTKKMWKATKDNAEAARKSAESLPRIERAYIFVGDVDFTFNEENNIMVTDNTQNTITIWLANVGKTPALLTALYAEGRLTKSFPTPKDVKTLPYRTIRNKLIPADPKWKSFEIRIDVSKGQRDEINRSEVKLICYGRIEYNDIFGAIHQTGFCWEWDPCHNRFKICDCDNEELNYCT